MDIVMSLLNKKCSTSQTKNWGTYSSLKSKIDCALFFLQDLAHFLRSEHKSKPGLKQKETSSGPYITSISGTSETEK